MTTASLTHDRTQDASLPHQSRGLHVVLWLVQALLAAAFLAAGTMKVATPAPQLAQTMPIFSAGWVWLARCIGTAEILGAIGLLLPAATRIKPRLTVLAALGLVTVMGLAFGTHLSRGEYGALVPNVVLGALAAFVAWGRTRRHPIAPR
jgi:uncharacterized membrane protein YphA (DoxX/SURF4 family)